MFEQTSGRTKQIKGHGRKRRLGCASQARTVDEIKSSRLISYEPGTDTRANEYRRPNHRDSQLRFEVRFLGTTVVPPSFRSTLQTRDTFGKFSSTLFTADLLERRITSESTREYKRFRNVRHIRICSSLDAPIDLFSSS